MRNTWEIHVFIKYMGNTWGIHEQKQGNTWEIHGKYMAILLVLVVVGVYHDCVGSHNI
jgi:hypothetical protein